MAVPTAALPGPTPLAPTQSPPPVTPTLPIPIATAEVAAPPVYWLAFVSNDQGNNEVYLMGLDPPSSYPIRVTYNPADDTSPSLSPDGKMVVFTSNRNGDFDLYVANTDLTGLIRLTDHPADDRDPAWSPDGTRIAFRSRRDGNNEIYVLDLATRVVTRLTTGPSDDLKPAWSPDGGELAFMSARDGNLELYLMQADGTGLVRLTCDPGVDGFPSFSPGGDWIVFHSDREGNYDVFVTAVPGAGEDCSSPALHRLTSNPADEMAPVWAGEAIWLMSSQWFDSFDLYPLSAPSSSAEGPTETLSGVERSAAVTADNKHMWQFDGFPSASAFHPAEFRGVVPDLIPQANSLRLTDTTSNEDSPRWSPDGSSIAFLSDRGGFSQISVMNPDGGSVEMLSDRMREDPMPQTWPAWSPDGKELAYYSATADGRVWLTLADLDHDRTALLKTIDAVWERDVPRRDGWRFCEWIAWLPDGERLLYSQPGIQRGTADVYAIRKDGTEPQLIAEGGCEFDLSREGSRLTYTKLLGDEIILLVLDLAEAAEIELGRWAYPATVAGPRWSPDGAGVLYFIYQDVDFSYTLDSIHSIGADGSDHRLLLDLGRATASSATWGPNGAVIAYLEDGFIYAARDDGSDLIRLPGQKTPVLQYEWAPDGRSMVYTSFVELPGISSRPVVQINLLQFGEFMESVFAPIAD